MANQSIILYLQFRSITNIMSLIIQYQQYQTLNLLFLQPNLPLPLLPTTTTTTTTNLIHQILTYFNNHLFINLLTHNSNHHISEWWVQLYLHKLMYSLIQYSCNSNTDSINICLKLVILLDLLRYHVLSKQSELHSLSV